MYNNQNQDLRDAADKLKALSGDDLVKHGIIKEAPNSTSAKKWYVCPYCGSGTHDHATGSLSARLDGHFWTYYCFSCGQNKGYDNIALIAKHYGLDDKKDFVEVVKRACDVFNIPISGGEYSPVERKSAPKPTKAVISADRLKKIHDVITSAQSHLQEFIDSQGKENNYRWRGLLKSTLEHFHCGYLPNWRHSEAKQNPATPRVIIPAATSLETANYLARDPFKTDQYAKKHDGTKTLFNVEGLTSAAPVIVVEGYIDAMSIWQAFMAVKRDIQAVALGGAGNKDALLDVIDEKKITGKRFILMFDADQKGKKFPEDLRGELHKRGNLAIIRYLYDAMSEADQKFFGEKVDANALLIGKGEKGIQQIIEPIVINSHDEFAKVVEEMKREEEQRRLADEEDKKFKSKIADWEKDNSKVNPATLEELKSAVAYLNAMTPENITSAVAQEAKTQRAVAMCEYYSFYKDVRDRFFINLDIAIANAKDTIKVWTAGGKLTAEPTIEVRTLAKLSAAKLRDSIEKVVRKISYEHYERLQEELKRSREEEWKRERAAHETKKKKQEHRFNQLYKMPPSPERDKEIVEIIREQFCDWKERPNGSRIHIKNTVRNGDIIFSLDPAIKGLIGFDEFKQADVFLRPAPWRKDAIKGDEFKDVDEAQLRLYIRRNYDDYGTDSLISDLAIGYSQDQKFNVVKDYFKSLPKWDGRERAETFFVDWLKVDDTPYAREVTSKWLLAAVARIFHPGCTFQNMIVIHGNQKIGKSYTFEQLGGQWYAAPSDNVEDPHILDALKMIWICEFKEMDGLRKQDVNKIKAFIERGSDNRRESYAKRAAIFKRHNVFAATVNDDHFLVDMTGNRRYWILHSNLEKFQFVPEVRGERLSDSKYIAQIWAEVYHKYQELFKDGFDANFLTLSSESEIRGEEIADRYMRDDGMTGEIKAFLNTKIPKPIIWTLLTKDERRKFFVEGKFLVPEHELDERFKSAAGKRYAKLRDEYDTATAPECDSVIHISQPTKYGVDVAHLVFFGSELRQHICAAEIFTECFGNDRRKSMVRINEILANLDGWSLGARLQKADSQYGDQKNPYYRDAEPTDDDVDNIAATTSAATTPAKSVADIQKDNTAEDLVFDLEQYSSDDQ